jgi:predicted branched-subunit amino acid permease
MPVAAVEQDTRADFGRGFRGMMPIWLGVVPFALALAIVGRASGLGVADMTAMSALVFAGAAQLAIVRLIGEDAGGAAIVGTVLLLNLRHVLYGLSMNPHLPARPTPGRPILAYLLTDESYGVAMREWRLGKGSAAYFAGAGASLWVAYLASTVAGAAIAGWIPDPGALGLEMVFPLCFLAILLPLLRRRIDWVVAIGAGMAALGLAQVASGGVTVLVATVAGAAAGAWLTGERR